MATEMIAASLALMLMAGSADATTPSHAGMRSDWPADCKLELVAQTPMTLISGHVTIPASINDKDVTLGIDTGGPITNLTFETYRRLGIAERWNYVAGQLSSLPEPGPSENFRIGRLQLDLRATAMDAFHGVDGLIGPDVLQKYDAEFDFGGGNFSLFNHHPCADHAVYWTSAYTVIPFDVTATGHIRVSITLDGQKTRAIFDTGSPISALSMRDANNMFGLTSKSQNIRASAAVSGPWSKRGGQSTAFPTVSAYSYPFKTMNIGTVTISDPHIELIEGGGYSFLGRNFLGTDYATLLLGNDVLSRFHLYIAYQEQKLYITDAQAH